MTGPARPVRFVVPYPPGGPTDILGRVVAARLAQDLGQPMVIENRAGASGVIGSEVIARAAPDGQAFLMNASIHVIIPHLNRAMPFDALADFTPVTNMALVPLVAVVNPGAARPQHRRADRLPEGQSRAACPMRLPAMPRRCTWRGRCSS